MADTYNTKITNSGIESPPFVFNASEGIALAAEGINAAGLLPPEVSIASRPYELPTIHDTQIVNTGVSSAVFQFTVSESGPMLLGASPLAPENLIAPVKIASAVTLATPGITNEPLAEEVPVGTSHELVITSLAIIPNGVLECAVASSHALNRWNLKTTNLVEPGGVDTELALRTVGLDPLNRIRKDAISTYHFVRTLGVEADNLTEKGGVIVDAALLTKGLGQTNIIDKAEVESRAELNTHNLSYSGAVIPVIQAGRVLQDGEIVGVWTALPVATLRFSDVYDENGVLAGVDAHDSVSDQTDNRWLRPDYAAGETIAVFTFSAGILNTDSISSIDTAQLTVYGASMGPIDNDLLTFECQVIGVDDITALTNRATSFTQTDVSPTFARFDTDLTIHITDTNAWKDARIYFRWSHTKLGALDASALAVSQLYLHGTYTEQVVVHLPDNAYSRSLTQSNPIPYVHAGVFEVLTCDDSTPENFVGPATVTHPRTLATDSLEQRPDIDNPISKGKADTGHILRGLYIEWNVVNYIERGRVWHDMILEGHTGLVSYGKIQKNNIKSLLFLSPRSLAQDFNFIQSLTIASAQVLATTSLDQSVGVEIEKGRIDTYPNLIPAIERPINYIEAGKILYVHTCVAKRLFNIPHLGEVRVVVEGKINAGIPNATGEIKSARAHTGHYVSALPCDAVGTLEDLFMPLPLITTATGLEPSNLIEPTAMLLPYEMGATGLIQESVILPPYMPLPIVLSAEDIAPNNRIQRGGVLEPYVLETTGVTQDNEILEQLVEVPLAYRPLSAEHEIEEAKITTTHILGARDAANDPVCEPVRVSAPHSLATLSLVSVPAIESTDTFHVEGILGSGDLVPNNLIQYTMHEIRQDRYATAMVIGV